MLKVMGRRHIVGLHTHRVPAFFTSLYSEVVYRWLVGQDVTHCIFMSDDLELCPRFWDLVEAMTEAQPEVPIGLDSLHPRAKTLQESGGHWYRCKAWMAGPAMLWPKWMLIDHMKWRDGQSLKYIRDTGDDTAWNEYIHRKELHSWHPVPSPVDHDADLPTAKTGLVERDEEFRRPPVLWHGYDLDELAKVATWETKEAPFFYVPAEEKRLGIV
jgi:hypothetical protein